MSFDLWETTFFTPRLVAVCQTGNHLLVDLYINLDADLLSVIHIGNTLPDIFFVLTHFSPLCQKSKKSELKGKNLKIETEFLKWNYT